MTSWPRFRAGRTCGFTLVELLVAAAVLSLLLLLLGQVVTFAGQAISLNRRTLDAAGEARLVFDRLALDLASRARRGDLGMVFTKATGNDSFQFYSEVDGYNGTRQISAVGYRIQETVAGRLYQLERGAMGTGWLSGSPSAPLVQFLPNTFAPPLDSDPNYDVLANGVFRLEFCFLLNTGLMSNSNGSTLSGNAAATDFSNVSAIVVALGVLDENSRALIPESQVHLLSEALPDDQGNTAVQDPFSIWTPLLNQSGFAPGISRRAVQGVRLYERTFCVP